MTALLLSLGVFGMFTIITLVFGKLLIGEKWREVWQSAKVAAVIGLLVAMLVGIGSLL